MRDTQTAQLVLNDDGVVIVRIRPGIRQSLADARQNLQAALETRAGRRRPMLIDISSAEALDAEVRHHYTGQVLVDGFTALALLIDVSPLGRMMGNVYLRVARPGIPTQVFTDEPRAIGWLKSFLP